MVMGSVWKIWLKYVLSIDEIKIWGYCTIFVNIFMKMTVFVNQKYFRTISSSTYSVGYTACDAFQTLSWSACCIFITLHPLRTQQARESACSAFMHFGMFLFFIRCSWCTHGALTTQYRKSMREFT